ncbi:MAG: hypothetical protein AAF587_07600 [Bacteroidota bacterium]
MKPFILSLFIWVGFCLPQFVIADSTVNDISILFTYTTSAAIEAGSPKVLKDRIDRGISQINQRLQGHHIDWQIRAIAEYVEIEYEAIQEAQLDDFLFQISRQNRAFNKVHGFRKKKKADLVCVITSGHQIAMLHEQEQFLLCHHSRIDQAEGFQQLLAELMGSAPLRIKEIAPRIAMLGEQLKSVNASTGAHKTRLLDPMKAPTPAPVQIHRPQQAAVYTIESFLVHPNADNTLGEMKLNYSCSESIPIQVKVHGKENKVQGFEHMLIPGQTELTLGSLPIASQDRFVLTIHTKEVASYIVP